MRLPSSIPGFARRSRAQPSFALRGLVLAACAIVPSACTSKAPGPSSGSIAISGDGTRLFVADGDNNQLVVVDAASGAVASRVSVGTAPARVILGSDGRIFVSNQQGRSVSVIDSAGTREVARVSVGTEPTGLALSSDGKILVVANATNATVSLIDTSSLKVTATIQTMADPTEVSIAPDGTAWVTHRRSGSVSIIDLPSATVVQTFSLLATSGETPDFRLPEEPLAPLFANGAAYIVHVQSLNQPVTTTPTTEIVSTSPPAGSSYASVGTTTNAVPLSIASGAVATVDFPSLALRVSGLNQLPVVPVTGGPPAPTIPLPPSLPLDDSTDEPPFLLGVANQALAGPSAAALVPGGKLLMIVHKDSDNVAIVSTSAPSAATTPGSSEGPVAEEDPTTGPSTTTPAAVPGIQQIVGVGAGPDGIAISPDATHAYVYNSFDHTVSVLGVSAASMTISVVAHYTIGTSPLTPQEDRGRRLFFSASNPQMSSVAAGGVACATCHPGARDDGRTWIFTEGPRNTPLLAGRHLSTTAPYHWDGLLPDMQAFNSVIVSRMGGSGDGTATASATGATPPPPAQPLTAADFDDLRIYIDSLPPPDNPFRSSEDANEVALGKALFYSTAVGCGVCHAGPDFTDNAFHDVGSLVNATPSGAPESAFFQPAGVNTPTLHNIFASAPYLHDGSKATLLDRVSDDAGGLHGHTSQLTDAQRAELVAYLNTL